MIVEIQGNCQHKNCTKPAAVIAGSSQADVPDLYCQKHADKVTDKNLPEWEVECPNCHCEFGVG